MARKRKSQVRLTTRLILLLPLPLIALWIYLAGQNPRQGLFESPLGPGSGGGAAQDTSYILPLPAFLPKADFALADTIQFYQRDNLYKKINGHDVAFFRFGFVSLTFASYAGADNEPVDIYAYRMNRPENAIGVYAAERSDERENRSFGEAGFQSGGAAFFYQGPYYVQLIPANPGEQAEAAILELVDTLCSLIPRPITLQAADDWFPQENLLENSRGFFPDNAFGTDFVGEVFTNQYQAGKSMVTLFQHRSDTAQQMHQKYQDFLTRNAEDRGTTVIDGVTINRFLDYGELVWIYQTDGVFGGLWGATELEHAQELITQMIKRHP